MEGAFDLERQPQRRDTSEKVSGRQTSTSTEIWVGQPLLKYTKSRVTAYDPMDDRFIVHGELHTLPPHVLLVHKPDVGCSDPKYFNVAWLLF